MWFWSFWWCQKSFWFTIFSHFCFIYHIWRCLPHRDFKDFTFPWTIQFVKIVETFDHGTFNTNAMFELFIQPSCISTMQPLSSSIKILYGMVLLKAPMHNLKINRFNHQHNHKGNSNALFQTTSKTTSSHHISSVQANLHCNDTPCCNLELYTLNFVMNTCHQNNEVVPWIA